MRVEINPVAIPRQVFFTASLAQIFGLLDQFDTFYSFGFNNLKIRKFRWFYGDQKLAPLHK